MMNLRLAMAFRVSIWKVRETKKEQERAEQVASSRGDNAMEAKAPKVSNDTARLKTSLEINKK